MTEGFDSIESAVTDIKLGKMVIVVDDEDRENEGDFIMAAEMVSPESINFLAKEGRGLICVSITEDWARDLDIHPMVKDNTATLSTNFTVTVDHLPTNTTGISAADRSNTIRALADPSSRASDFGRPGHIFPIIAKKGGVLRRAGHTEASKDLAKLAGFQPVAVLCEIMNEDGTMARVPDLMKIAKKFDFKIITIQDLIRYKRTKELFVEEVSVVKMPTKYGEFNLHTFVNKYDDREHHMAMVFGDVANGEPCLLRVHSECLTGDTFGSYRCDCGPQLDAALKQISEEKRGALVYLRQEGRGIGFVNKMMAYKLQDEGLDTVEANEKLGFKPDLRDYGFGAQIIHLLGLKKIKLMTNNPKKIVGLKGYDIEVTERVPIEVEGNTVNQKYLDTKRDKLGHVFLKKERK
jgi:3,4-dihydroxy 2-butanone 4-phosphate synthase / GTP cyclohydrolase II